MKTVSKQKSFEEGNKRFWCAIHIPSLNPTSFLSAIFSRISKKNSIQATHNSPHLVGLQAHLMDHITIASASVPLSHRHRDNDGYIERSIWPRSKWLKSRCPQIRRIIIFIYFSFGAHTIWEILPKVYESTWKNILKFLDEIFNLKENGDFSQFRKILVCGEWQPIPGEEVPLAQYCAETGFRTNLSEYY